MAGNEATARHAAVVRRMMRAGVPTAWPNA